VSNKDYFRTYQAYWFPHRDNYKEHCEVYAAVRRLKKAHGYTTEQAIREVAKGRR
jgi:hypothetical protein